MMTATVIQKGKTPTQFKRDIDIQFIDLKNGIAALAEQTAVYMKTVVSSSKKVAADNLGPKKKANQLEDSITVERISDEAYGIGNTQEMDAKAPYWYLINYGGMPRFGGNYQLVPGQMYNGAGDFMFHYDANSPTLMGLPRGLKPNAPLHPMNYVEKTQSWLRTSFKIRLNKI